MLKVLISILFLSVLLTGCFNGDKNRPPTAPSLVCPPEARVNEAVTIIAKSTDPDNDEIAYKIRFGDGVESEWSEFFPSGQEVAFTHQYREVGDYGIKAISSDQKAIGEWSEAKWIAIRASPEDHHTENVYKITHSTSAKEYIIQECAELGFNVIHTNDVRRSSVEGILKFLNKCQVNGVMGFPRIDRDDRVPDIIRGIKNHPALLAVGSDDEAEGERIPLEEQYKYYAQVKSVAPDLIVMRNWNGTGPGHTWEEYFPPKDRIKDVCDVVLFVVYPYPGTETYTMESEWNRAKAYLNPDTPVVPIMQAFYHESYPQTDLQAQWDFWKQRCNSYALYVRIGELQHGYTGFSQDQALMEQVRQLNAEVE